MIIDETTSTIAQHGDGTSLQRDTPRISLENDYLPSHSLSPDANHAVPFQESEEPQTFPDVNALSPRISSIEHALGSYRHQADNGEDQSSQHHTPASSFSDGGGSVIQERIAAQSEYIIALLLRHYVEHLARWLDLCDAQKHFQISVPQRARSCPPLMSAILCSSARHLDRSSIGKDSPDLAALNVSSDQLAVYYHTEAIQALLTLTSNQDGLRNEDLLAAAILLRWHEEIDAPLRNGDQNSEIFLQVIKVFIDQQLPLTPIAPQFSPSTGEPDTPADLDILNPERTSVQSPITAVLAGQPSTSPSTNLRQASFWIAFRQEIYTCYLKQRSFNIPLSHCSRYRAFTRADDVSWAKRLLLFCADCIEFCYGSIELEGGTFERPSLPHSTRNAICSRWQELRQLEILFDKSIPPSFKPIFDASKSSSSDVLPSDTTAFAEIWYLTDWHVTGIQHLELARILLVIHDPFRPKLGPGHLSSMQELNLSVRQITGRLCGMALGHRTLPPIVATACLAIAVCGDYFTNVKEQEGLLNILKIIEREHGWPFGDTVTRLKSAWGWEKN